MSKFEKPLPEWHAPGIEPPPSNKEQGWKEGVKPPAEWHNWWMHTTYKALVEIREHLESLGLNWDDIGGKPSTFPPSSHKHPIGDVTGLQVELNAKETPAGAQEKVNTHENKSDIHTTRAEKNKLAGIEPGAQKNTVTSVAGKTGEVSVTKSDVGLSEVENVKQARQVDLEFLEGGFHNHLIESSAYFNKVNEHLAESVMVAKFTKSAHQSIPSGVTTDIVFDNVENINNQNFAELLNGQIKILKDGIYKIDLYTYFMYESNRTGARTVYLNNSYYNTASPMPDSITSNHVASLIPYNTNEIVFAKVLQNSGVPLDLRSITRLDITKLG